VRIPERITFEKTELGIETINSARIQNVVKKVSGGGMDIGLNCDKEFLFIYSIILV